MCVDGVETKRLAPENFFYSLSKGLLCSRLNGVSSSIRILRLLIFSSVNLFFKIPFGCESLPRQIKKFDPQAIFLICLFFKALTLQI